ncbi:MAG: hypothetical protein JWP59_3418 [Massilia sp.]|jgi:hypothetical protein|nr:hypothetical protein [Massilia sp.]
MESAAQFLLQTAFSAMRPFKAPKPAETVSVLTDHV